MTPLYYTITLGILSIYAVILYHITGKNRNADRLLWAFGSVTVIGFIYHMILFSAITMNEPEQFNDIISKVLFALQYSLKMFIANTIIFKGDLTDTLNAYPSLFKVYIPIYGAALLTSGFAVFHFLSRRLHNWFWLTLHHRQAYIGRSHIFIGINNASLHLAEDIAESYPEEQILFIDFPDQQDYPRGLSIWDIIARFFKDSNKTKEVNDHTVLRAGKGLAKLSPWLENKNNITYILSDNQDSNLSILETLWEHNDSFKCRIYCHTKREGLVNRYDSITDIEDRIVFVDSSYLAVESMKKATSGTNSGIMLPVNYVDIATGPDKTSRLGYVESSFNCAVIGFGETGKEALKFLYEFGAFPDKENKKAPFKCHIFDSNLDMEAGRFGVDLASLRSSTAYEDEFAFHSCKTGTAAFRTEMMRLIPDLNYIVICLGNDDINIETALDIVELAEIQNVDTSRNFCIAIKQSQISKLNRDTLTKANIAYNHCIHPFGMFETIWKKNIISDEGIELDARRFFDAYTDLSREMLKSNGWDIPDWDERASNSRSDNYRQRCKARRQMAQDYFNCLHINTKRELCRNSAVTADMIYPVNDGAMHCTVEGQEILEHLAVCEHLRWEASHLLLGYRPTNGTTDDAKKLHNCLKPYSELDEVTKHFDWLVVKNSL